MAMRTKLAVDTKLRIRWANAPRRDLRALAPCAGAQHFEAFQPRPQRSDLGGRS